MKFIRHIPYLPLIIAAIFIALAPFKPEPHLLQKLRMLFAGVLTRPIDIFDLFFHASPALLLLVKIILEFKKPARP